MSEQQSEQKPKILVVDDSRVMRFAVKKILGKSYTVIEAENGELAWNCISEQDDIQLVFSDINMPVLDGIALLDRMRNSEHLYIQSLPVVIITGKDDDEQTKIEVLEKGASDFITKPFDSVQLRARAKSYVRFNQTLSTIDELTGLSSLAYHQKMVDENIAHLIRHGGACVLIQLEIENFKNIFIRYGKKNADIVITKVGKIILDQVRAEDRAARISLSLFSLFLMSSNLVESEIQIKRIRYAINELKFSFLGDEEFSLSTSVAMTIPNLKENNNYLSIANITNLSLNSAIESGGNRIVIQHDQPQIDSENQENNTQQLKLIDTFNLMEQGDVETITQSRDELLLQLVPLLKHIINDESMLNKLRKHLNI